MLFVTNRTPMQSAKSVIDRQISFDYQNTSASQYIYFCERHGDDNYTEIMHEAFFKRLKDLPGNAQILFYIHGFDNNMEPHIFKRAERLQELMDEQDNGLTHVVPIIWPCDDDSIIAFADDYWDDQDAADASGPGFARMLGKFDKWRREEAKKENPCMRRINVIAHSMGNRVLMNALKEWSEKYSSGHMPQIFRNVFMIAADVKNEALEKGEDGRYIVDSSRNVVVYYANDDFAMPASKLVNIRNKTLSRRMGMTGPEDLSKLPRKVFEVDCDEFNNDFDLKGHSYFLDDKKGNASPIIKHMADAIQTGRVSPNERRHILESPLKPG